MAGKNERDLRVNIIGDARQMKKATKEAESGVAAFEKAVGQAGTAIAAAFAGGAILNFAKQSIDAALEDQRAQQRLAKTLQNVTAANKEQVAAVEASIAAMQRQFAVADDELRPAFETIVRATKDVGQAQQLMQLALDISAGSGKNLQEVSVALVKALGGQTRGLKELGITLKDTEGKALSADEIFAQLRATFAGQAEELANSQVGKLKAVGIQYDELKETVGTALLPALTQLADVAQVLFGWFNNLDDGTQKFIAQVVVFGGIAVSAVKAFTAIRAAIVGMNIAMAASPWGLVATGVAALSALTFGLISSGDSSDDAAESAERFADAVKLLGFNTDSTNQLLKDLRNYGNAKDSTPEEFARVSSAIKQLGLSSAATAKLLDNLSDPQKILTEDMKKFGPETYAVAEALQELVNQSNEMPPAIEYGTKSIEGATEATVELAEEVKPTIEELEKFSKSMWETGETASEMARSIIDAVDDIRARFDQGFAADKAELELKEGLATLEEDLRKLQEGTPEYRIAIKERAEQALNYAEELANTALQTRKLSEAEGAIAKNQMMINRLADVRSKLASNSPLRKELDAFIDQLLKIPGTYDARINVTVGGMPGIAASDIRGNNFGLTPDQIAQMLGKKKPRNKRAAGGPVTGGEVYLVGEQGPEVFVAGQSGQIIPNHALGGGGGITINVTAPTGTDPYTWGNAIVSALKSYVRVNGKIAGLTV